MLVPRARTRVWQVRSLLSGAQFKGLSKKSAIKMNDTILM